MSIRSIAMAFTVSIMLISGSLVQVSAGGPICPPPVCGPPMCAPPVCPPPVCGPPPCCPPPICEPNPLAMICVGAFRLVTGVIALPFKVVDSVITHLRCGPRCCPPPMAMCAPPACLPPMCGPAGFPPPSMGYGMGSGRPVGFGRGAPRRFAPMAKEKNSLPLTLMAAPSEGFFGAYW